MLANYLLIVSDSDDSDVEDCINLRKFRKNLRDCSDPFTLPDERFVQRFRLNKSAFKYVLDNINLCAGTRSTYVPPILRLCSTLEVLAGGGYQWLVGNDFASPLAQSTLSKILHETINAMENVLCPQWIKWPSELEEGITKSYFFEKFKIPGVIGCVDGTHISMMRPILNEEMFFNRKGHHSINTMIIADHKYRITAVCPQYGGAAHDSFVWNNSSIKSKLESHYNQRMRRNSILLGDSGYPLEPWLLTPYRKARRTDEIAFNTIHSKARSTIERCIGVLKGRWRILLLERKCRYDPKTVSQFINVCSALHNICIEHNVPVLEREIEDDRQYHRQAQEMSIRSLKRIAERNRDVIKASLLI